MICLCSAWEEELQALRDKDLYLDARLIQAGQGLLLRTLGIGYVQAALSLQKIIRDEPQIQEIIFVGTCGSYNDKYKIGDLLNISSVTFLERGAIEGSGYLVSGLKPLSYNSAGLVSEDFEQAPCLSSLEISSKATKILDYYHYDAAVENMELLGVAKVASDAALPWRALLAVSNYTNAKAHEDWLREHKRVSALIASRGFCSKSRLY